MSTQVKQIRFFVGRQHQINKRKINKSTKNLTDREIYDRKQASRSRKAEAIGNDERLSKYIEWISSLQSRAGLSNEAFATRLSVTSQTIKLWKRKSGVLPSEASYKKLLDLEKELSIPVKLKKFKVGVRFGTKSLEKK